MRILLIILLFFSFTTLSAPQMDKDGWMPFTLQNGHITIDIEINGKAEKAMIDSGATVNGISRKYVDEHKAELNFGERIIVKGLVGEEELSMVNRLPVMLFGHEFKLNDLAPMDSFNATLILGLPFLNNFIAQFDYPNQKIRILPHAAINLRKVANVELNKSKGSDLPVIKVAVSEQKSLWLTLDTGSNMGLLVTRQTAEQQNWLKALPKVEHDVAGTLKSGKAESFNIPYLKIGPYELENVMVTVPAEGQVMNLTDRTSRTSNGVQKGMRSQGLLGYDILQHFILTLDTKNWQAHIAAP